MVSAFVFHLPSLFAYKVDYSAVASDILSTYAVDLSDIPSPFRLTAAVSSLEDEGLRKEALGRLGELLDEAEASQVVSGTLQPGSIEGLKALASKDIKSCLISELGSPATGLLLGKLGDSVRFQAVVARDSPPSLRAPKDYLASALKALGVKPEETLSLCTSLDEIRASRDAGVDPVVLPLREHDVNALLSAGPTRMIMSMSEIDDMLTFLPRRSEKEEDRS